MPGVVILNEVVKIIENTLTSQAVVGIKYVKFIRPLRSDREVVLHVDGERTNAVSITCEHNGSVIVKGQLVLSEKDAA